jgi:thiamine-phosphate pyrophosphorylase
VIVNDRADVALLAGADGVHVGQSDLSVAEVRRLSSRPARRLLVGVSCSGVEQAREAVAAGADYLGLGPMFASTTKVKGRLAGPALVEAVVRDPVASRVPHLAISGINESIVGELLAVGCRGVAVSAAVCGAEDVAGAVRALLG